MERHEADGRCGWSWTSLLSRSKAMLETNQINLTLQIALQKDKHEPLKGSRWLVARMASARSVTRLWSMVAVMPPAVIEHPA